MEKITIAEHLSGLKWDYDTEADVLYLSVGEPKAAIGMDIGNGMIVRFDEKKNEVVGLTVIGLRGRVVQQMN
jgi:uncharacterized protein YuzE